MAEDRASSVDAPLLSPRRASQQAGQLSPQRRPRPRPQDVDRGSWVHVDSEGKHPIVEVDLPRAEGLLLGQTVREWRARAGQCCEVDDGAELIAKLQAQENDTSVVIGGRGSLGQKQGG